MIKLIKSTFLKESETKEKLAEFIKNAPMLSMGKECGKFEESFARKQERKFAVFVSSGSMANLVLMQALLNLGLLKKGDNVAVSALTWSTNVMPLFQLGLCPIVFDCELGNLNISADILVEGLKKNKIKALFITHVLGFAANIDKIKEACFENDIILLEDTCESLGSKVQDTLLGNFGLASTFSSFVGHHFSTIEGGVVVTDDEKLYEMLVMVRAHGWDRNLHPTTQTQKRNAYGVDNFYAQYTFYDLAYNARPTEIQGFLGNTQIEFWDEIVSKRENNFLSFIEASNENPDIYPIHVEHMDVISNFAMPIVLRSKHLFEMYKNKFIEAGVEIRPVIAGNIAQQPFFKKYSKIDFECPNAEIFHQNGFYFGNNPEFTSDEVALLCSLLKK